MASNPADRGKAAEKKLKDFFSALSRKQTFTFYRLPDAHAGSMTATLADFLVMCQGQIALVECKSIRHEYRLPHGNFDVGQVARMRTWKLAGASAFVMIYHETLDKWRSYDLDKFITREGGSWDLRDTTPISIDEAFKAYAPNHS